ncbi:MAG: hypothetical protein M0004_12650 [Actinomycetota bacterium]|nr:hypothetical protein [Actinomycetota bacterium]
MKRIVAVIAVVAGLALAAPAAVASVPSRKPTVTDVKPMLLSVDQMPAGWSVTSTGGGGSATGCVTPRLRGSKPYSTGSVAYQQGSGPPEIEERLAAYSGPLAKKFAKVVSTLAACRALTMPNGKRKVHAQLGQMSFPKMGNQSAAFALTASVRGINLGADILMVRKGQIVLLLMELDLGTPSLSQFEHFAHLALAKVR